ncbi:zf-TFIIB domain-containing protein [Candidatus Woesearchaeota archaeon]|nr:zf-TFIIB domain-containing protein [Candidatus Woesearchaeota archaeon]
MVKSKKVKKIKCKEQLLLCPRCNIHMKKLIKKDVIIDVCPNCKGMWVDAGELEKLAEMNL